MHPVLLTLTTGRSGTVYLYHLFTKAYPGEAQVYHEELTQREAKLRWFFRCYENSRIESALLDPAIHGFVDRVHDYASTTGPVLIFGNSLSHLAPLFLKVFREQTYFLLLNRNLFVSSASSFVGTDPTWWDHIPEYSLDYYGNKILPSDPYSKYPRFKSHWNSMNLFEKILYNNLERVSSNVEFVNKTDQRRIVKIDTKDMFLDPKILALLAKTVGLEARQFESIIVPRNETWLRTIESNPFDLGMLSQALQWPEIKKLCTEIGHRVDEEYLRDEVKKYCLPNKLGSMIRHRLGYWQKRRVVADFLRKHRLIEERPKNLGAKP